MPLDLQECVVTFLDAPTRKALKATNRAMRALATTETARFLRDVVNVDTQFTFLSESPDDIQFGDSGITIFGDSGITIDDEKHRPSSRYDMYDMIDLLQTRLEQCRARNLKIREQNHLHPYVRHTIRFASASLPSPRYTSMTIGVHAYGPYSYGFKIQYEKRDVAADERPDDSGMAVLCSDYVYADAPTRGPEMNVVLCGTSATYDPSMLAVLLCACPKPPENNTATVFYHPRTDKKWRPVDIPDEVPHPDIEAVVQRCFDSHENIRCKK